MKRTGTLLSCLALISFPSRAESLSAYYLRFVSSTSVAESIEKLVYVFCGIGALVSLVLVFYQMADQDQQAARRAQQWCLSLVLIATATLLVSTLLDDARSVAQVNLGAALATTTTQLTHSFGAFSDLVYVVCGMVALVVLPGKVKAMQQGDRYAGKGITSWCLALISVVCLTYVTHIAFFS